MKGKFRLKEEGGVYYLYDDTERIEIHEDIYLQGKDVAEELNVPLEDLYIFNINIKDEYYTK